MKALLVVDYTIDFVTGDWALGHFKNTLGATLLREGEQL